MESVAATGYSREQARIYDETRFISAPGAIVHRTELNILLSALRRVGKQARVLEVGCGTGRLLLDARASGFRVDGIDASPNMLEMLREKTQQQYPDLELRLVEAARLPYPDDTFDLVYCIRVLNQTESPQYALNVVSEMLRTTKPGGYALVEFVNAFRPRWGSNRQQTVRLRPRQIMHKARSEGAQIVAYFGAFILSMQAYNVVPRPLLRLFNAADRGLSWLFPRLCARSYVLLRKGDAA